MYYRTLWDASHQSTHRILKYHQPYPTKIIPELLELCQTLLHGCTETDRLEWQWDKILGKQKRVPKYAWDVSGASNLGELHQTLIHTIMIRRMKSEVLDQLPDKIRTIIPLEIDNKNEYDYAEENFSDWLSATHDVEYSKRAEALVKVNYVKQLAVKGKVAQAIAWIEDVIQTDKLVVFCDYHESVDALMSHFKKRAVRLTGKETQTQRQKAIDEFQTNPKIKLFVGNIKAEGVAITLTAAFQIDKFVCIFAAYLTNPRI